MQAAVKHERGVVDNLFRTVPLSDEGGVTLSGRGRLRQSRQSSPVRACTIFVIRMRASALVRARAAPVDAPRSGGHQNQRAGE
jgi:hypothetical protein